MLDGDDSIAVCQPKIKDFNNKAYFQYLGASGGYIDKYGYPFCRGNLFDTLEKDGGQFNNIEEIFWASGSSLFIRSRAYHNIGGLDEDFSAQLADLDLCWRLKNKGFKIMSCPTAEVYHVGNTNQAEARETFLNNRNSLLTFHKNHPKKGRLKQLFIRLCLDLIPCASFLLDGKPNHTWAITRSHFAFYGSILKNKTKREAIHHPNLNGMLHKSIVNAYFINKRKTFNELLK